MKAISLYVIATGGMKMIICRCEEVTLKDIQDTADKYECSAREVKLRTRAGMGYCGGRTCRTAAEEGLEEGTGVQPGHELPLKGQPPVRPVSVSVPGGQRQNGEESDRRAPRQ